MKSRLNLSIAVKLRHTDALPSQDGKYHSGLRALKKLRNEKITRRSKSSYKSSPWGAIRIPRFLLRRYQTQSNREKHPKQSASAQSKNAPALA